MEQFQAIVSTASDWVWGTPLLVLLVGTGIYLTIRLRGLQFRGLWHSLYLALVKRKEEGEAAGDITHFQALMTALAATVGTGNIVGVATAIAAGGPGALFWMWITGLFGMATKYSEAVLAVKYRIVDEDGTMSGGPMYYISRGLGWKWLGVLFAIFAAVAAFGIGNMVQSNSVADAMHNAFHIPEWLTGVILTVATAAVILGGIKSIARVTSFFVPIMIVFYMLAALVVIIVNIGLVPEIFLLVFKNAFTGTAAMGGFLGATVREAIRFGVARGVFSNESGLGSSPIAAAAAQTKNPVTQALVSMTQTFIDTIVVCSMTGFVILVSGAWKLSDAASGKALTGAKLTITSFNLGLPGELGGLIVPIALTLFAYSTILGWSYYGEKSIEFLLGAGSIRPYRILFVIFVFIGSVAKLQVVWSVSDVFNGLMAFPNLIGLLMLSKVIVDETNKYFYHKSMQ
ncbi:MAG: sodium:alanine symporter family protein [candidate division KSB1 bacterium]|nr:sodium:alanine symporter family protein [candidate division KSB1 bacterium]